MNNSFDDFVKRKIEKSKAIDWSSEKELWLSKVDELYNQIEYWLKDWIEEKKIRVSTSKRTIVEEHIGQYEAPVMKILIGSEKIELNPVGTLIIAGRGRIDVKGRTGEAMLILLGKNEFPRIIIKVFDSEEESEEDRKKSSQETISEPKREDLVWKYAKKNRRSECYELDKELFEQLLMDVSGR